MKPELIRQQHLALKTGIFITGIASAFELNTRQLAYQSSLYLLFMLLDKSLYSKLLFALRKLLIFFTGYWLFATLFGQDFPDALLFSGRILYLLLVMVFCWAAVDKKLLLYQSRFCLLSKMGKRLISFILNTFYFLKEYLSAFRNLEGSAELSSIVDKALQAGAAVHQKSDAINAKTEAAIAEATAAPDTNKHANALGLGFLSLLVLLSNV
ncbi:MAG: hypothetical protein PHC50_03825 [Candidatus Cloacimonetes bacterium]|nr:hypothetical protein [Candidatus Cloacimonadota bacterium]